MENNVMQSMFNLFKPSNRGAGEKTTLFHKTTSIAQ